MSDVKPKLRAPFRADKNGGYVFDADGLMVAQVRGWGQLQRLPNAEAVQDANLQYLVDALNEKAARDNEPECTGVLVHDEYSYCPRCDR